jgi:hypothetical protein
VVSTRGPLHPHRSHAPRRCSRNCNGASPTRVARGRGAGHVACAACGACRPGDQPGVFAGNPRGSHPGPLPDPLPRVGPPCRPPGGRRRSAIATDPPRPARRISALATVGREAASRLDGAATVARRATALCGIIPTRPCALGQRGRRIVARWCPGYRGDVGRGVRTRARRSARSRAGPARDYRRAQRGRPVLAGGTVLRFVGTGRASRGCGGG